mmetsp:Transcript_21698/g.72990  ORF Transcript_21698/g.72990 Transcript_21698/m.72990 type:complete len:288 (-) Transcript_21698:361-1224(-)
MSTPAEIEKFKGYVALDEYKKRREELEDASLSRALKSRAEEAAGAQGQRPQAKKRKKSKPQAGPGLSFEDDEGAGPEEDQTVAKKVFKAPGVDTSFLAKNDAEKAEHVKSQEQRMRELLAQQRRAKEEAVTIEYAFRNEQAKKLLGNQFHRGSVEATRGTAFSQVLDAIHARLSGELQEKVSSQLLLVVSNGLHHLIMPAHMCLHDVQALKWKEGAPMFPPDKLHVHVAERAFLDANKHLFPMTHWEHFDEFRAYSQEEAVKQRERSVGVAKPAVGGGAGAQQGRSK